MNADKPIISARTRDAIYEYLGMLAVLVLLVVVFSLLTRGSFLTNDTFWTIIGQVPAAVIIAVGMTYVLIIAGIDLSVGSVLALSGGVLGVCIAHYSMSVPLAIMACLAVGLACGLFNGLVTVTWRLPSFIVTLGMLEIARGTTYEVTARESVYIGMPIAFIVSADTLGGSVPFLIAVAVAIFAQAVLSLTVFGRYMIAVGTNEEAVRLSGIDPRPIKVAVFALCGMLAALAAVLHTARVTTADPNAGGGFELQAIAAVVIGGTSLMGGRGSVIRSFFGVLIIAVLGNGLVQIDAGPHTKRIITGCVIIGAVILDHYRQRLKRPRR